jgi:glycosyltransferase involved in cell wall biosynthesis
MMSQTRKVPARVASSLAEPLVTIILPTRDEQGCITDCLDSLLAQDYARIVEILVVDGRSTDRTRTIAARRGDKVRIIDNPGLTAAAAMNRGLAEATTQIVVRADAHTLYEPDYVRQSVAALLDSGADWVGGTMRPVGTTAFGRAVARVTASPFGVGPGRFHYATEAQDVETVYLGTFDKEIVDEVGGFDDTELQWAAEDAELTTAFVAPDVVCGSIRASARTTSHANRLAHSGASTSTTACARPRRCASTAPCRTGGHSPPH